PPPAPAPGLSRSGTSRAPAPSPTDPTSRACYADHAGSPPRPAPPHPGRRTAPAPHASDPPRTGRTGPPDRQTNTHAARIVTLGEQLAVTRWYARTETYSSSYRPTTPGWPAAQGLSRISGRKVP